MPSTQTSLIITKQSSSPFIKPEPVTNPTLPPLPPHLARKVKREDTPRPTTSYFADFACFRPYYAPSEVKDRRELLRISQDYADDSSDLSDLTPLPPTPQPTPPPSVPHWLPGVGLVVEGLPPTNSGPSYHHFHCRRDARLRCQCDLYADRR